MYIGLGAIVSLIVKNNATNPSEIYIGRWSKFYILAYFMTIAYSFNTSAFCGSIVAER